MSAREEHLATISSVLHRRKKFQSVASVVGDLTFPMPVTPTEKTLHKFECKSKISEFSLIIVRLVLHY